MASLAFVPSDQLSFMWRRNMDDHPFFLWSLAEATHWIIHLPLLGFLALIVTGVILFFVFILIAIAINR